MSGRAGEDAVKAAPVKHRTDANHRGAGKRRLSHARQIVPAPIAVPASGSIPLSSGCVDAITGLTEAKPEKGYIAVTGNDERPAPERTPLHGASCVDLRPLPAGTLLFQVKQKVARAGAAEK
jgi:hypothetical protein